MNFRKFITASGKEVLAGKSAENNEEIINQVGDDETVLHTAEPGSPFANIKANWKETSKKDLKEAAVFCAKYSKDWRDNKKDVEVHVFFGKEIFKTAGMKTGTFGVKKVRKIKVNKEEILEFEAKNNERK